MTDSTSELARRLSDYEAQIAWLATLAGPNIDRGILLGILRREAAENQIWLHKFWYPFLQLREQHSQLRAELQTAWQADRAELEELEQRLGDLRRRYDALELGSPERPLLESQARGVRERRDTLKTRVQDVAHQLQYDHADAITLAESSFVVVAELVVRIIAERLEPPIIAKQRALSAAAVDLRIELGRYEQFARSARAVGATPLDISFDEAKALDAVADRGRVVIKAP